MLKHADSRGSGSSARVDDRPSKRARLSPNSEQSGGLSSEQNGTPNSPSHGHVQAGSAGAVDEDEDEDEAFVGEPERATDMYLDTVRTILSTIFDHAGLTIH